MRGPKGKKARCFAILLVAVLAALGIAQSISSYDLADVWPSRGICLYRLEANSPCFLPLTGEWILWIQVAPTGYLTPVFAEKFASPGHVLLLRVSKSGLGDFP